LKGWGFPIARIQSGIFLHSDDVPTILPQSLHFTQVRREKHSTSRWRGKWGVNVVAFRPPHGTCERETPQCSASQPKAAPSWLSMDAESLLHSKGSPV